MRAAAAWYDGCRAGLGDEFLAAVDAGLAQLEDGPDRFPLYYRSLRRLLTDRFPYKIFFRIRGDEVIVSRVLHSAREHKRQLRRE